MTDYLSQRYPTLATQLQKCAFARLPTPITHRTWSSPNGSRSIAIKRDDLSSDLYGGNKIRKLEYVFRRALDKDAKRVATFGAVGSNHALATALFAQRLGLGCTCFLGHQKRTPNIARTLNMHARIGTELVRYGGSVDNLAVFRKYLQGRHAWVIPMGGTSWLGVVGFINAALEFAAQVENGETELPERVYIANGTMGSAAGLALGFALIELPIEVHAVRVVASELSNIMNMQRIMKKTSLLLHRLDADIAPDLWRHTRVRWRDGFYAGGYASSDAATENAVAVAKEQMDLSLETTYTGKAMAALVSDVAAFDRPSLFWNTYNSQPLPVGSELPVDHQAIPDAFMRYFDA